MVRPRTSLLALAVLACLACCAYEPVMLFVGPLQQFSTVESCAFRRESRTLAPMRARGGAEGGLEAGTSDAFPNVGLFFGALIGLYAAFLVNYGFLGCISGDPTAEKPTLSDKGKQYAVCAVADTLYGADDLWFQVRCKLKLIEACRL
eukprot:TRINITY_DN111327_c0_g1_i1.p2 TRINITY_DN111327_c0_g1~~TRINITY_DN111327_c0_g1_i1.p2  ORF type:complete len:148 (+),score=8.65 TRINITY_DN111327_c0_g1_i1:81-524(+)